MLTVIMNILIMALIDYKSSSIIQPCTKFFPLPKVETTKKNEYFEIIIFGSHSC